MKKTNTLVIMSDQHHAQYMGCAGHPIVQTPNLDRLAARGTHFPNAYTPSPICVPARAAFATGLYPHTTHYWDNAIAYDGRVEGWGQRLQAAGLDVSAVGKLHYRREEDDVGFDEQLLPMHIADGIGQVWGLVRDPLPVRQFGELMVATAGPRESKYNQYDRKIATTAAAWLEARAKQASNAPWTLYVGFVAPHFPYNVPQEYFDLYPLDRLTPAEPHPDRGWTPNEWVRQFLGVAPGIDKNSDEERLRCTAAYLGLCTFLDANVGIVLDALDTAGFAPSTRVVYTSDHGDQVGSRGHWGKSLPYEASVGIPMIMAGPDVPADRHCRTGVSLIDMHPTILQSTGLEPDAERPGRSLLEIVSEPDDENRLIFSEYHAYGSPSAWFVVRRGRYKYIEFVGFGSELYDLEKDPLELVNLIDDPSLREVRDGLARDLHALLDPEAVDALAKADQGKMIDAFGGVERALSMGTEAATPAPE